MGADQVVAILRHLLTNAGYRLEKKRYVKDFCEVQVVVTVLNSRFSKFAHYIDVTVNLHEEVRLRHLLSDKFLVGARLESLNEDGRLINLASLDATSDVSEEARACVLKELIDVELPKFIENWKSVSLAERSYLLAASKYLPINFELKGRWQSATS